MDQLNQVRGPEYALNAKEKVMDRMDWLNHLRLVFNMTANSYTLNSSSISVTTEAFLNKLIENVPRFPLMSSDEIPHNVQYLSFQDIFESFEGEFGQTLS